MLGYKIAKSHKFVQEHYKLWSPPIAVHEDDALVFILKLLYAEL